MLLLRYVRTACLTVGCFALAAMVLLPASQILLRTLGQPMTGSEELTRYFLIVVTFTGIPLVTYEGGQIRMDELLNLMPIPVAAVLRVVIAMVSATTFATVALAIWSSISLTMGSSTPTLGIPFWLFTLPALVGLAAGAAEYAVQARRAASGRPAAHPPRVA